MATASGLIKVIIRHENGAQPYSDKLIADSLRLAGSRNGPPKN